VAHCNHRLRGAESEADVEFVAGLCRQLDVHCEIGVAEVMQTSDLGDGLEAAAREARYRFLSEVAGRHGARYVATAHTADDQAETVLHRILRGTGLAGLAGIPRVRPLNELTTIIRPLLWARRSEVLAYLAHLRQNYRQDSTNLQSRFTRNRIRHELLPQLAADYNPAVVEALVRLGQLAGEAQGALAALAEQLREQSATPLTGGGWVVDAARLAGQPRYVVREMLVGLWRTSGWPLQDMGKDEWERLAAMIGDRSARTQMLPGNVVAQSDQSSGMLRLTKAGQS
jgi:tRNA(Ile)-lysidine synthase